jgi:hypothetical protein
MPIAFVPERARVWVYGTGLRESQGSAIMCICSIRFKNQER